MPLYSFACPDCGHKQDELRSMDGRNDPATCEKCSAPMGRDITEELGGVETEWTEPIYSEAAGVSPDQVAEARRVNKNHEYTDDGRMIFRSHKHRQQCLKDIGMVDRDGFY